MLIINIIHSNYLICYNRKKYMRVHQKKKKNNIFDECITERKKIYTRIHFRTRIKWIWDYLRVWTASACRSYLKQKKENKYNKTQGRWHWPNSTCRGLTFQHIPYIYIYFLRKEISLPRSIFEPFSEHTNTGRFAYGKTFN